MVRAKLFMLLFLFTNVFAAQYGTIYASANLRFVFPEMIEVFYKLHPEADVHIQYGGSGSLTQDILDGNEYDLFLAANMKYPQIVYDNKKAIEPPKVYTQGKIVFYLPKKLQKKYSDKVISDILVQKDIQKIVVANKETTPYGAASIEILKHYKIYAQVKDKIEYTSDIATAVYELLWNREVGFVPKSALLFFADKKEEKTNWIDIDQSAYHPLVQAYVLSQAGSKNINAKKFLDFLLSEKGQDIFKKYGYVTK